GGLAFAPAHDQGALNPGFMPLFVALVAAVFLGEKSSSPKRLGLMLILAGAVAIVGWHTEEWSSSRSLGHALFLSSAFLWAGFTVAMRWAELDPLHAASLVSVGSSLTYLPAYLALNGTRLAQVPVPDLAFQAMFQGVLVTVVSLILYGHAI